MKIPMLDAEKFLDDLKKSFDAKVAERMSGDVAQAASMIFDYSMLDAIDKYSKKLEEEKEEEK